MKSSKPVIAVDIDEVLAGFIDYFIEYHNLTYKTQVSKENVLHFDIHEIFGITKEEAMVRMVRFGEEGHNLKMGPVPGSVAGVDALFKKGYELHLVTSRPKAIRLETESWIEKYFPGKFTGLHNAFNSYIHEEGSKKKKWEICKDLGAQLLIDDFLSNVLDCAEHGITGILMDGPWNQRQDLPKNVIRVKSWKDIVEKLT